MSAPPPVGVGVAALAHVLGERVDVAAAAAAYTEDLDRVRSWEYRGFHRAGPGVGVTDLAVVAGGTALDRAGLSATDVDLVVLAIPDLAEYLYWDPAAHTQARLGAHRAEAVLLDQACGGAGGRVRHGRRPVRHPPGVSNRSVDRGEPGRRAVLEPDGGQHQHLLRRRGGGSAGPRPRPVPLVGDRDHQRRPVRGVHADAGRRRGAAVHPGRRHSPRRRPGGPAQRVLRR